MLAKMVTIRQKLDRAPKQTSGALSQSAADHGKVISIDPDRNDQDIGAVLRQQRIDDGEVAQNQAAKSRLGRWMQRTKLSSPGIQDSLAKTDDVVSSGSIWLAIFNKELFFVKVIGALKHYRGGKKPCKDVLLKDLEVITGCEGKHFHQHGSRQKKKVQTSSRTTRSCQEKIPEGRENV